MSSRCIHKRNASKVNNHNIRMIFGNTGEHLSRFWKRTQLFVSRLLARIRYHYWHAALLC
jgi:hypothetical protein